MLTKIALAQMYVEPGNIEPNYSRGQAMIDAAAESGCNLILLPELWTSGYPIVSPEKISQQNFELIKLLKQTASDKAVFIGGTYLMQEGRKFYNRFLLLNPKSDIPIYYDKIHLFKPLNEDKFLSEGRNITVCNAHNANIGLSICYDLRFPELFRAYAASQVDLIALVAEWPLSRINQWKILIQARAVENQAFFAAVNSVGKTRVDIFGGTSLLVDPYGNILCSGSDSDECLLTADCDLELAASYRHEFPVLQSHRNDLFEIHQRDNNIPTGS